MTDGESVGTGGGSGDIERLILGSSSHIAAVVRGMNSEVTVGTADEGLASTLRDNGVKVEPMDPTDSQRLVSLEADVVFIFDDVQEVAVNIGRAVQDAFPDAYVLAYAGEDALDHGAALESLADEVLAPGAAVARRIVPQVGNESRRRIWDILGEIDNLAVVTHDNPDPDAIGSAVALARLAETVGCEAQVCYYGDISHQENQAFVNLLDLDLRRLEPAEDIDEFDGFALVDHARAGINNGLPTDTSIDIVIDHHPPRGPIDAEYVDLRTEVGATSTMLVEYLDTFGVPMDEDVATALLFGIHIDTDGFTRGVAILDFEAAATLVATADLDALERIEMSSIDTRTLDAMASAITNRRVEGTVLLSYIEGLPERDALAQAADQLLQLEGVSTTIVYGVLEGTVYISARSRAEGLDIGEVLREAFGPVGTAGGHVDMAGAQLDIGVLDAVDDEESLGSIIESVVADRLIEIVEENPPSPAVVSETPEELLGRYGESAADDDDGGDQ